MTDIFDNTVLCKYCSKKMGKNSIAKKGFSLRTLECTECNNQIIHPEDLKEYENFQQLRRKNFRVKLRYIGNSYAVSIPREIIDFMAEQENELNDMVDLCFEKIGKISLQF